MDREKPGGRGAPGGFWKPGRYDQEKQPNIQYVEDEIGYVIALGDEPEDFPLEVIGDRDQRPKGGFSAEVEVIRTE